jgi:hypothetical protein
MRPLVESPVPPKNKNKNLRPWGFYIVEVNIFHFFSISPS